MGRGPADPPAAAVDAATLAQRVRFLTRLAAVLGVLVIAAIALGVYAIARDEDDASEARVERIDRSIDELERRVAAASEESDTVRLSRQLDNKASKRDVQRIEEDVDVLRDSVEESDSQLDGASRRLGRMERRLDRIADSVEALRKR
jgi:flagellar motility protein MotE (MotC chaperone)